VSPHSRDSLCPRFTNSSALLKQKGAGKTGCALHPRSHVHCASKENAHEHTGSAETLRPSLRNGFTTYIVLSLVNRSLLPPSPREALASQGLDASNPGVRTHDFAVRLPRGSSARSLRPSRPAPTSVTTADVPSRGTGCTPKAGDLRSQSTIMGATNWHDGQISQLLSSKTRVCAVSSFPSPTRGEGRNDVTANFLRPCRGLQS
jgi:hypothetical protein